MVLNLLGVGTLTLSGDSSTTGATGDNISVINGTLNVTGKIGAAVLSTATNGTISGAGGTIGALTVNTGTVAPGGTLKTAAVTLNAATNYSAAVLTATTASNLESASAINLGGSVLSLSSVAAGLAVGNTFTIINNTHASNVQSLELLLTKLKVQVFLQRILLVTPFPSPLATRVALTPMMLL